MAPALHASSLHNSLPQVSSKYTSEGCEAETCELGLPQEVAEALIKKVMAPTTQKTRLIEAKEHEIDGRPYYSFEFVAQAPNYTRHALSVITGGNGKFYTLTTGANERRWGKMKDNLHTGIDSFKLSKF